MNACLKLLVLGVLCDLLMICLFLAGDQKNRSGIGKNSLFILRYFQSK
jgi:hypothetical protein